MNIKASGHPWTKSNAYNIVGLPKSVHCKKKSCVEALKCTSNFSSYFKKEGAWNEFIWIGNIVVVVPLNTQLPLDTIRCVACRSFLFCITRYVTIMYQVTSKHASLTRASIHCGHHNHALANDDCRDHM